MSDEEYHKTLPKKQTGTAVLLFNEVGHLLIVKPNYKDGWLVPGGAANENESPTACARRETKEEIGLDIESLALVGVYYAPAKDNHSDSLKFLFYGGVLSEACISKIVLQKKELLEYTFLPSHEAIPLLSSSLRASIPDALDARARDMVAYREAH